MQAVLWNLPSENILGGAACATLCWRGAARGLHWCLAIVPTIYQMPQLTSGLAVLYLGDIAFGNELADIIKNLKLLRRLVYISIIPHPNLCISTLLSLTMASPFCMFGPGAHTGSKGSILCTLGEKKTYYFTARREALQRLHTYPRCHPASQEIFPTPQDDILICSTLFSAF